MFEALLKWLRGFLIISISGNSRDRFLDICSKHNIVMWNIVSDKDTTRAYIARKAFRELEAYQKKTGVDIRICDKRGLPFFFYRYKKRKCFAICLILCVCLIYAFTLFIWDINISGESVYTKEQIRKDIIENYISLGTFKRNIDCAELEKKLREKYDQIAWISCEIKGTQLNITLTETVTPGLVRESEEPCNIVAVKDGIITDMITRSGSSVAHKGDEVKKGDILITGVVNIYNDFDELTETQYLPASGDVYAISQYQYDDSFFMEYYEKEYSDNEKHYYSLGFGDRFFSVIQPKTGAACTDVISEDHKLVLAGDFYLPLSVKKTTLREYTSVPKTYTEDEAREKAEKRLALYLDNLRKKGVEILENNVTIEIVDGTCTASGSIVTKELIGVPAEINIIEQGETP